jgi:hypothetical protein
VEQTDLLKREVEILDQLSIPDAIVGAFASGDIWAAIVTRVE